MTDEPQTLEEMLANFYGDFDLERDGKFMMLADAKDRLRPLLEALQARIVELEHENESLKAKIKQTNYVNAIRRPYH